MIGLIVATDGEMEVVETLIEQKEEVKIADMTFFKGKVSDKDVVLCKCGIGKVAAGILTSVMINNFAVELVVNIGVAGGLKDILKPLDIIIADRLTYHDWDTCAIDFDYTIGFEHTQYVFEADEELLKKAKNIMDTVNSDHNTYIAPIISGDQFISEKEKIDYLTTYFPQAYAADMESCSVAHSCTLFKVPYIIIRSLSDIVVMENNSMDYMLYKKAATRIAYDFFKEFIREM